jgi:hypothetical protein
VSREVISPVSLISRRGIYPDPLHEDALHGIVGEIVATVSPHSESDPVAIVAQTLVAFGNAIGRTPHARVERSSHYTNLYAVLVGNTSKARKGTSWDWSREIVERADPRWEPRVMSGLSSGEGLISRVADSEKSEESEESPPDHRLLVVESEFVSTLKVAKRDGNTLSAVVRSAWDTGKLSTLTRHDPLTATGAHISLLGHITAEELTRYLDATETANGFANRFLWFCVRRSKSLPDGGSLPDGALDGFSTSIGRALAFSRLCGEIPRDPEARELWHEVYDDLSEGEPGLVGALLARAEAQVLRLSVVYALLDHSKVVRVEHLRAALAVWSYADRSVRFLFGDSTGNPEADVILRALRETGSKGLTRTEISALFARHVSVSRTEHALDLLLAQGLAIPERIETGGRPSQRWTAIVKERIP